MNIAQLKDYVVAHLNRAPAAITTPGATFDLLLMAINNAKTYMQRRHNFEMARVPATLPSVSATDGADLSAAVLFGTATPVQVKTIERAFLTNMVPIDVLDRDTAIKRLQRRIENGDICYSNSALHPVIGSWEAYISLVRHGNLVYLYPRIPDATATTTSVHLDIVKWLPDYDDVTVTSDFFSVYCPDFLLYRTIVELNRWLKEDQAYFVSEKKMESEWNNILAWDTSLIIGSSNSTGDLQ